MAMRGRGLLQLVDHTYRSFPQSTVSSTRAMALVPFLDGTKMQTRRVVRGNTAPLTHVACARHADSVFSNNCDVLCSV